MGLVPFDEARRTHVLRICDGLDAIAAYLRRTGVGLLNQHHDLRSLSDELREMADGPSGNGRRTLGQWPGVTGTSPGRPSASGLGAARGSR